MARSSGYRAIVFDLDNTLLNYDECESDSMRRAVRHHRLTERDGFSWDDFWNTFSKHSLFYWEQRVSRKWGILQVLEFALRDTFGQLGEKPSLAADLARTYWEFFCNTCHFEEGAFEIVQWAQRNYKLGIVSNGIGEAQRLRLKCGRIDGLFESIVVSDEVGYWKPDPHIFYAVFERLNVKPEEVLFVGDSLRDDYGGALNAGIDFCFYNRKRQPIEEHIQPKYIINKLSQLENII